MFARRLRRLLRNPHRVVLVAALVVGMVAGALLARAGPSEAVSAVFGAAWSGTPQETRGILATLFGVQITVLTIVLSLNAQAIQSAANQYSPRLVPFYLKHGPLRRAMPLWVLSLGYLLAAVRELGLIADDTVRPRIVVSGAILLLCAAISALTIAMFRTFGFMRVERVLGLVRDSAIAAAERVRARVQRFPLDPAAALNLPPVAALGALASGYIVEIDIGGLVRRARRDGVRVRICRAVGDYVDRGEVVGWVAPDGAGAVEGRALRRLAALLAIAPVREPDYDPIYGIRILADVAARALTSSVNDAYTAKQALQQVRSVLRRLAPLPQGNWNVVDPDGTVRVSVMAAPLREYIAMAVGSALRHGAGEPEVLEGVLEIALEVGLLAGDLDGRAAAHDLVARVLDGGAATDDVDRGRLQRLRVEADLVQAWFERTALLSRRR